MRKIGINLFSFGPKLMHFANGIKFGKTSQVLEVKEPWLARKDNILIMTDLLYNIFIQQ